MMTVIDLIVQMYGAIYNPMKSKTLKRVKFRCIPIHTGVGRSMSRIKQKCPTIKSYDIMSYSFLIHERTTNININQHN